MNLSEFIQLLYPYLADGEIPSKYIKKLFDNLMEESNGNKTQMVPIIFFMITRWTSLIEFTMEQKSLLKNVLPKYSAA